MDSLLRGSTRRLPARRPLKKRPRTETGPSSFHTWTGAYQHPVRAHFIRRTPAVCTLADQRAHFTQSRHPPRSRGAGELAFVALAGYHVLGARAGPPKLHLRAISSRLPKKRRVIPSARRLLFPVVRASTRAARERRKGQDCWGRPPNGSIESARERGIIINERG
jgi:hypothetical protein